MPTQQPQLVDTMVWQQTALLSVNKAVEQTVNEHGLPTTTLMIQSDSRDELRHIADCIGSRLHMAPSLCTPLNIAETPGDVKVIDFTYSLFPRRSAPVVPARLFIVLILLPPATERANFNAASAETWWNGTNNDAPLRDVNKAIKGDTSMVLHHGGDHGKQKVVGLASMDAVFTTTLEEACPGGNDPLLGWLQKECGAKQIPYATAAPSLDDEDDVIESLEENCLQQIVARRSAIPASCGLAHATWDRLLPFVEDALNQRNVGDSSPVALPKTTVEAKKRLRCWLLDKCVDGEYLVSRSEEDLKLEVGRAVRHVQVEAAFWFMIRPYRAALLHPQE